MRRRDYDRCLVETDDFRQAEAAAIAERAVLEGKEYPAVEPDVGAAGAPGHKGH